jgi:TonB family protein
MKRRPDDQGRFGITAALAVSVIVHLLLIALGWLFPFHAQSREPVYEETTLHFDLTPMEDVTRQSTDEPRGQVPIPVPPTPAQQVPPEMQQALDSMAVPPSPAEAPPPVEEILEEEAEEATEAEESEAGLDLPGDGTLAEGVRDDSEHARTASPQERQFNVDEALRDFGRVLQQARPESEDSPRGLNIPDLPPLPPTGFGFGNLEFESRDFDWSDYARQIYMAIWRAWHNRLYATTDEFDRWAQKSQSWTLRHSNRITFTIQKNGQVTAIALETPSGCYPLDDSALDALREVIIPPLPRDFPRDQETVHARFIAEGNVRTMRSTLAYLKRMGYF